MKKERGITLIALVITIIILLILAGITIVQLTGSGIFEKAALAEQKTQNSQVEENTTLTGYEETINKYLNGGNIEEKPKEETVEVPSLGEDVSTTSPIEITTYMAIRSNTINTLNLADVENVIYEMQETTEYVSLTEGKLIANNKADSKDSCRIKITGTYSGQSYTNNLTVYVELKNIETLDNEKYYQIYTAQDLKRFSELVNSKVGTIENAILKNEIDLSSVCGENIGNWIPIGNENAPYIGKFNGDYYTIDNIYIYDKTASNQGLFGIIGTNGEVCNLIIDGTITANCITGGIAGRNGGYIYQCENRVTIEGGDNTCIGGIAGANVYANSTSKSIISSCVNFANLKTVGNPHGDFGGQIGGIAGSTGGNIIEDGILVNCYNRGNIEATYSRVGGIAGITTNYSSYSNGTNKISYIYNVYSTGKITGSDMIGSVTGHNFVNGYEKYLYTNKTDISIVGYNNGRRIL